MGGFGADANGLADGVLEAGPVIEEVDLHPQEENGDVTRGEGREADGVFLGGNEGKAAAGAGTGERIFHLSHIEAVVVGKGALVDDFRSQFDQALEETFRNGDTGDGTDAEAAKKGEGLGFAGDHILEVERVMGAGEDAGVAVVAADLFFESGLVLVLAFGEKDEVGALEGVGWFAEDAAGEDVAVAEGILAVDEEEIEAVAEAEVLVAVVEEEGVGAVVADGVPGGFDAVGIDEDGDAGEVAGEHEGFVAGLGGVEQDGFSVRDDAGRGGSAAGEEAIGESGEEGFGDGFVTAAEDGDAAASFLEGAGEFFDNGGFAGAADGEVADADDEGADGVTAKDGIVIKAGAKAHDAGVDGGEKKEEGLEEGGAASGRPVEDDVGGELLERLQGFQRHGLRMGIIVYVYDYVYGWLVAWTLKLGRAVSMKPPASEIGFSIYKSGGVIDPAPPKLLK